MVAVTTLLHILSRPRLLRTALIVICKQHFAEGKTDHPWWTTKIARLALHLFTNLLKLYELQQLDVPLVANVIVQRLWRQAEPSSTNC